MAEKFVIEGKKKLEGVVEVSGAKNDAGPIIAATLLTEEPCIIDNLPLVEDIFCLLEILKGMGSKIDWQGERTVRIENKDINPERIDPDLVEKTRASVLFIAPLLSRFKEFKISRSGGDKIGLRPITTHLKGLKELGVEVEQKDSFYHFKRNDLKAGEVVLREFSVTASENLMTAAAGIEGETVIKSAATEPHVQDLGKMLQSMGAEVEGIGTHKIKVRGKKKLKGVKHTIIPDYLEAGTFVIIGAVTPGVLRIERGVPYYLDLFLAKLEDAGVRFEKGKDFIEVDFSPNLRSVKIQALPYPGFPTDLLPITVPLLTQAEGRSLIHDPLYENRLNFIHELRKMGADIEIVDPHRAFVFGKTPFWGINISSWDIRAGASLVIAGLMAQGKTVIDNIYQIDRGYEKIDEKLQGLGANIKRI